MKKHFIKLPGYRKYNNIKTFVGEKQFDSKKEAKKYQELLFRQSAREIKELEVQKKFEFPLKYSSGRTVTYVCDFYYYDNMQKKYIVFDSKGVETPVYKIKWALMKYFHNIEVQTE